MKIYKNCNGRKIKRCFNCDYIYAPIHSFACGACDTEHIQIEDVDIIQGWCPLEDYKEKEINSEDFDKLVHFIKSEKEKTERENSYTKRSASDEKPS